MGSVVRDLWSTKVARVVVLPLSGYINRMQAIASASIIANQSQADLLVCWTDINVTPAAASEIFSAAFMKKYVIDESEFSTIAGIECREVPPYLNAEKAVISVAGLDKGEQAFMPELQQLLIQSTEPVTLIFSAGGNFSFSDPSEAMSNRGNWYRHFMFSHSIEDRVSELLKNRDPFIAVHLRYTDRSHETPLASSIIRAVMRQAELLSTDSVFIASDSEAARDKWFRKFEKSGLKPWTASVELDGILRAQAGVGALVDWKTLGHARSSVFFAASSFGHEAAVMAGSLGTSVALEGHPIQRIRSRSKELAGSLANYPRNHWFR